MSKKTYLKDYELRLPTNKQNGKKLNSTLLILPHTDTLLATTGLVTDVVSSNAYQLISKQLGFNVRRTDHKEFLRDVNTIANDKEVAAKIFNSVGQRIQIKDKTSEYILNEQSSCNKVSAQEKVRHGSLCMREGAIDFYIKHLRYSLEEAIEFFNNNPTVMFMTGTYEEELMDLNQSEINIQRFLNQARAILPKKWRECATNAMAVSEMCQDGKLHAHILICCPELASYKEELKKAWTHGHLDIKIGRYAIQRTANYLMKDELLLEEGEKVKVSDFIRKGKSPRQVYLHPHVAEIKRRATFKVSIPLTNSSNVDMLHIVSTLGHCEYAHVEILQRKKFTKLKTLQFYTSKITDYVPNATRDLFNYIFKSAAKQTQQRAEFIHSMYLKFLARKESIVNESARMMAELVDKYNDGVAYANQCFHKSIRPVQEPTFYTEPTG